MGTSTGCSGFAETTGKDKLFNSNSDNRRMVSKHTARTHSTGINGFKPRTEYPSRPQLHRIKCDNQGIKKSTPEVLIFSLAVGTAPAVKIKSYTLENI